MHRLATAARRLIHQAAICGWVPLGLALLLAPPKRERKEAQNGAS